MRTLSFLFILWFCFASLFSHAQNTRINFSAVDYRALNVPIKISENIDSLAFYLTSVYETDIEKTRSIFRWVTDNINYDVSKKLAVFKNENDFSQVAIKVLLSKKAVCEGYSNLFYELCKRSGLIAEVVTGYATSLEKMDLQPHAWNAVKINDDWKLIDATWAAGGVDERINSYHKSFDANYFCMNVDSFLLTHYPTDPMWQLTLRPLTYNEFKVKKTPDKNFVFSFTDSIAIHFSLLETDSMLAAYNQNMRSLQYNPDDFYAKTMLQDIKEYYETEKFDKATDKASEATQLFNDVITIVNDAKKKRSSKKLNEEETVVTKKLSEAKQKMNVALEMYNNITFTLGINKITQEENISRIKKNLNLMNEIDTYLKRYFKTPLAKRISVL